MSMLRRAGHLGLLLGLVLSLLAGLEPIAWAQEARAFRQHYDLAVQLYEKHQYQDALKEFQAAYALKQFPRVLLNMGQVHRRLGHAKEALGYYELYLRVEPNPDPKIKVELDRYIAQTKAMLHAAERVRREAKDAMTNPEPVDPMDRSPEPPPPPLSTTKPPPALQPRPAPAPAAPPAQAARTQAPLPTGAVPQRQVAREEAPPLYRRTWFKVALGVTGAVVVGGIVTGVVLGTRGASAPALPEGIEIKDWSLRRLP